jgi:hypothetical protein
MNNYYFLFLPMTLLVLILIRVFVVRKKSLSDLFFSEALKNENDGYFNAAIINYKKALIEVKKSRLSNNDLKIKIIEKLKTLHTVTEYNNNFQFLRYHERDL